MHLSLPVPDEIAAKVLSVLLSSVYRKNSLTAMHLSRCRLVLMAALSRRIRHSLPIQITVLAFPFKVPNPAKVGGRIMPDFAELAAIRRILKLRTAIQHVYPPGLEYHILHDGHLIAGIFGVETDEVRQYQKYFCELVKMVAPDCIRCHDFGSLQRQCGLEWSRSLEELQVVAARWFRDHTDTLEWRSAFRKTLGMINLREFPAQTVADLLDHATVGRLPSGWQHIEDRVHSAMVQYHVADAIIHQFDPRSMCFPDAIHATTQERQGRLALWMVRRGQSLLPWHGVGCLDERGQVQVVSAIKVLDRGHYEPVFVYGENTPFAYRKGHGSAGINFAGLP
jgi:pyoverdine/dityrosine biosynthesis protein Dit1